MKSLYIIGNGFDIHHDLDTKYQSFAKFLAQTDREIYELLLDYYGLPNISEDPAYDDDDEYWEDFSAWSNFEIALADLNYEQVLEDNSELTANPFSPEFRDRDWHTYQVEMEEIVKKLTFGLISKFNQFICNVEYPDQIYNKKINIISDSLFLTFNYTHTLEKYYNIDDENICHIHGKSSDNKSRIVLGHGTEPSSIKTKRRQPPEGLSEEELDEWNEENANLYDYSSESAKSEILSYFKKAFKDTQSIISNNVSFFERLRDVENIYVLGHSISSVDIEYFKTVKQCATPQAKWYVTYYNDDEKKKHIEALTELGINTPNIVQLKLSEL